MAQDTRATVCDSCGKLVSVADARCPSCGAIRVGGRTSSFIKKWLRGRSITKMIFWSNIFLYIAGLALSGASSFEMKGGFDPLRTLSARSEVQGYLGVLFPAAVTIDHEIWRLLTYAFLHGGILHILFNMMSLRAIGPFLEESYGSTRFAIVYLGSAVAGGLAILSVDSAALGASGAIFGMMGAGLAFGIRRGGIFGSQMKSQFLQWILEGVVLTFVVPGISVSGHLGGLAGGFVIGYIIAPDQRRSAASNAEPPFITILSAMLLIAVPVSFAINITKGLILPSIGSANFAVQIRGRDVIGKGKWVPFQLSSLGAPGWVVDIPAEYDKYQRPLDGQSAYFYPKSVSLQLAVRPSPADGIEAALGAESNEYKVLEPIQTRGGVSEILLFDDSTNTSIRVIARNLDSGRMFTALCRVKETGEANPSKDLMERVAKSIRKE